MEIIDNSIRPEPLHCAECGEYAHVLAQFQRGTYLCGDCLDDAANDVWTKLDEVTSEDK